MAEPFCFDCSVWGSSTSPCKAEGFLGSVSHPATHPGRVFIMAVAEVQEGRSHCKRQLCVTSAKILLAKASFIDDPEVKGQGKYSHSRLHG